MELRLVGDASHGTLFHKKELNVKSTFTQPIYPAGLAGLVLTAAMAAHCTAQSSSLFDDPAGNQPLTLSRYSWTYEAPRPQEPLALHDLVTVIINEQSVVRSEGEMDRKKKAYGDLTLTDWILLKGWAAIPDPQSAGDPKIAGKLDNKLRSEASMETRDSMKFRITCAVVDIRPNGNLIIEGHDTIHCNREVWDFSFTGEIRPEDVLPNNTILSESIANKRIYKREKGHVRDGYRRGWLLRILDKWQPF